jgi:Tol biopolymer transport system component
MTPEKWEHIGRLYAAASALPAEARSDFLQRACEGDPALREELESLLASDAVAGDFLAAGALSDAAKLLAEDTVNSLAGGTLGHYEIRSLLGSGGMGEVYRAHDSRLGRDVAIKVLPDFASQNDSARMRFHNEAQAVAGLSHPNIRSLFDVGEADGRVYAVMELLEGETLRARLVRGPLSPRKATEIGALIADGVAAAHARGVVHRDLKPENVFITDSGQVKVLDFGLAKMQKPLEAQAIAETESGVILGTASYMSPEQVAAKEVDAHSDIFSLGCILYEMVSGRRAFERKTGAETMAAILNDEPPEPPSVGGDLRRIIARCLEKQPDARFQSAQDLAFHLRTLLNSTNAEAPARPRGERRLLWAGVPALLLVATLVVLLVQSRQTASPTRQVRFEISPPHNVILSAGAFALSPDGSRLAFVAASDDMPARRLIWIHSLETGESQPLSRASNVMDVGPVWSPDGRYIAFVSEGTIRKIAVSGGSPQTVAPATAVMAWNADDVLVFGRSQVLMKVSAAGGAATPLTALDPRRGEMLHYSARFLPDGRHFLYVRSSLAAGLSGVFVGSIDAKPEQQDARRFVGTRGRVDYAPSVDDSRVGHLLFNREGTLFAQGFDAARLELAGEPVPVAEQVGERDTPHRLGFFSVAGGALVYRRQETVVGMPVWLDPSGRSETPLPGAPLTRPEQLRLSPDGRRLAVIVAGDVWVHDLGGRPPVKVTSGGGNDMPLWTPDGTRIVYSRTTQPFRLLSVPADSAGATPEAVSPEGHFHPHAWSSDGHELILVLNSYSETGWDILRMPLGEKREPIGIVRTPSDEGVAGAALSPDGRWLAYTSNATGETEVWVQPYPGPGASIRVSSHGGADPQWARNGRHLYYLEKERLMATAVAAGPTFSFKPPTFLFEIPPLAKRFPNQSYDVGPDGRFITIKDAVMRTSAPPMSVILNWHAGLMK